jgi:DNA-binding transcriptional LysR family regulator
MKIGSLIVLDAFVRLGGTGEAAQGLGLTQSAVIKALRLAEQELDLDLVSAVQGRLMPTPEALALRERAQGAFAALRRARHEADMIRVGMARRLRIATVPGLAHSILPLAITQARMALEDDTPIEIMFDHVADHLGAGEADLAISYGPLPHEGLVNIVLGESPLVCVLAHEHALASHSALGRAELLSQRLISYAPDGFSPADSFQQALTQAGLASRIAIAVRHTDTACHLARQGIGVAIVDGFVISSGLTDGLAVRELSDSPRVTAYAHHDKGLLDRAARILLDCLAREAA